MNASDPHFRNAMGPKTLLTVEYIYPDSTSHQEVMAPCNEWLLLNHVPPVPVRMLVWTDDGFEYEFDAQEMRKIFAQAEKQSGYMVWSSEPDGVHLETSPFSRRLKRCD